VRDLVERTSTRRAARSLDLSDATIARICAGLPVHAATLTHAEQRLAAAEGAAA